MIDFMGGTAQHPDSSMASRTTLAPDSSPPRAVFISYRRSDSLVWAARLARHIGHRFGHDLVFRDVEDIPPGQDWREVIDRELARCRVFLVVIGPHWVEDAHKRRRLADPKDVLRHEVAQALRSPAATVIPVLVGGTSMPAKIDVPRPLLALLRSNALAMRAHRWSADLRALLDVLHGLVLPTAPQLPLAQAQAEANALQLRYFAALESGEAAQALQLVHRAHDFLDRALPLYPQDPYLKKTRGYLFKNEAMALLVLQRVGEAHAALDRAEAAFRTLLIEHRRDAVALNGVGSVLLVRADARRSEGDVAGARRMARRSIAFIDKALAIDSTYAEARGDREMAARFLRSLG